VIDTDDGLTVPFAPTVIIAPLGPGPVPDGVVGRLLPPSPLSLQAINSPNAIATAAVRHALKRSIDTEGLIDEISPP
jgi:hypothetical protein